MSTSSFAPGLLNPEPQLDHQQLPLPAVRAFLPPVLHDDQGPRDFDPNDPHAGAEQHYHAPDNYVYNPLPHHRPAPFNFPAEEGRGYSPASYSTLPLTTKSYVPRSAPMHHTRDEFRTPSPTESSFEQAHPSPEKQIAPMPRRLPSQQARTASVDPSVPDASGMRCTDFVAKLWFLLDRIEYANHIRWNSSGESFIFFPTKEFASDVLARLFKHSNVASFVRQLNLYGFQRISHLELLEDIEGSHGSVSAPASVQAFGDLPSTPASGFQHPDFLRGQPGNLNRIRPKPTGRRKTASKKRGRGSEEDDEFEGTQRRRY